MGVSSLCFVAMLIIYGPFSIGRRFEKLPGPCQPFKAKQTTLCSELQSFAQDFDDTKFCNSSSASCRVNNITTPIRRKDAFWGFCYCDELCKDIGDCCVDYNEWYSPRVAPQKTRYAQICRRKPSNEKSSIFGYVMVANCPPSWKNTSTLQKCLSTNYTADPATALPVLEMTENVTYANIYCAMCHGKTRDLHHWSLRVSLKPRHHVTLQDITSTDTIWEAIPVEEITSDKCLVTPSEANIGPKTKTKQLCRAYANSVHVRGGTNFKNPHCAVLSMENSLTNISVLCHKGFRFPPRIGSMLFVFSRRARASPNFRETTVRLEVKCSINEIYDPFKGRCLPVYLDFPENTTDHAKCRGPRFLSNEFRLLVNYSVYVISHQKIYNNDSYILLNQTLLLCSNFSGNYIKTVKKTGNHQPMKPPHGPSLTMCIITFVGFSLSIISLLILLVTYFLFAELRTFPGKTVMHLSCAMIAMQSVYFASDPDVVSSAACAVLGALLHYSILAVFLWMSAIAHSIQKTFSNPNVNPINPVVVAGRKQFYIGYCLFSWGFPFVAVGICVALQLTNTGNVAYGAEIEGGCQLSLPARTYAVAIPVSLSLLYNIVALIRTAVALKQGQGNMVATNQTNLPIIVLNLTAVTGIPWILGFALAFHPKPYLEYPFVIINSCQGVLICITFVFKKHVFNLYKKRFMNKLNPETGASGAEKQTADLRDA